MQESRVARRCPWRSCSGQVYLVQSGQARTPILQAMCDTRLTLPMAIIVLFHAVGRSRLVPFDTSVVDSPVA